jgi:hypothetical protein
LLEGLIDMGSCALHDRLEPAELHRDQLPTGKVFLTEPMLASATNRRTPAPGAREARRRWRKATSE